MTLAGCQTPIQLLSHVPSSTRFWEKIRYKKTLVGFIKDLLIRTAKAACASKGRRGIHSLLPIIRQIFSPFPGSRASAGVTDAWKERQCHYVQTTLLPSPFSELLFHDILWYGIHIWVAVLAMSPPKLWCRRRERENHDISQALLSSSQNTSLL